jgi:hypothetical protein
MPKGIFQRQKRTEENKLNCKIGACKRVNKPVDDAERFWSYVDIKSENECWEWKARKHKGYGYFRFNSKWQSAHRVAYVLTYGEIPEGFYILHHCDNHPCCNPSHLFKGTQADNMADMVAKGRSLLCSLPGSKSGMAKFTEEQVLCIRILYQVGILQCELAKMYNVSWTTIMNIVKRRTWKHI